MSDIQLVGGHSSPQTPRRPSAKMLGAGLLLLSAVACTTTPGPGPGPMPGPGPGPNAPVGPNEPAQPPPLQTRDGLTPPFMAGQQILRIGVLLPFRGRAEDARAFYDAAELALFDHGDGGTLLIPRDAGETAADTDAATRALLRDGADVIIGPLVRDQVAAAGRIARSQRVPVIGFSTDREVAGDGTYLLSFQFEDEVQRIVRFAVQRGATSFALFAPDTEYGRRVQAVYSREVAAAGGRLVIERFYARNERDAASAAREFAPAARAAGAQAILIPEGGAVLRSIGPALLQGGISSRSHRLLGTSVWSAGDLGREPTLAGGFYAAPEPGLRTDFETRFRTTYGRPASRQASLAYDAVALAALLSRNGGSRGLTRGQLELNDGFTGVDGLFRLRPDGSTERGLAVMEVRANAPVVADPAPRRFGPPGS